MNAPATIRHGDAEGAAASTTRIVLVIEDERTQRLVLRTALEREGFRVEEAVDGLSGLQAFDRVQPDLVLLDVRMPGMDGFATCEALRRRPGAERLPILMLTVLNDIESINQAYDAGATDFITKPVAWPILGHRLRYMLRASEAFSAMARSESELIRRVAESTAELNAANAELAAANRELETFGYSVSHDLRGPLRAVLGFSDMLKQEMAGMDARKSALLGRVIGEAHRMAEMIEDLLRFSRVSRDDLTMREVDLAALVARSIKNLRDDYPATVVNVSVLPVVTCNAGLMEQVFENLIGNALKYSSKTGAPRVEIGMQIVDRENVYFVRDNGVGFDMVDAPKLFGVFSRLHSEKEFPGTGVGLAIVKRIVERHLGRIWANSARGNGTTFFFTLGNLKVAEGQTP